MVQSTLLVVGTGMIVVQYPKGRGRFRVGDRSGIRFRMDEDRSGIQCQMGMVHQYRDHLSRCFHWERGRVLCRIERCMGLGCLGGWNRPGWGLSLVGLEYRFGLRYRL